MNTSPLVQKASGICHTLRTGMAGELMPLDSNDQLASPSLECVHIRDNALITADQPLGRAAKGAA